MEPEPQTNNAQNASPQTQEHARVKLYCVGSAEINQFYIPYPEGAKVRRSVSRKPVCISDIQEFVFIDNPDKQDEKTTIIPNPLLKENLVAVACGGTHSIALTSTGKAFTWGSNDDGALGRTGEETVPMLVQIDSDNVNDIRVDQISAGDSHSMFLNSANSLLFFCGSYKGIVKGFLNEKVEKPTRVKAEELGWKATHKQIKKIVSGVNHSLLLLDDRVLIRGDSEYFISGRKTSMRRKQHDLAVERTAHKFQDMGLKGVVNIWTGSMHSFAKIVTKKKTEESTHYYAWGNNGNGQLGLGHANHVTFPEEIEMFAGKNIKKIVGGEMHTVFLTEQGEAYSCGKNDDGQLGLSEEAGERKEEEEGNSFNKYVDVPTKIELEHVKDIGSGLHFSFAVTEDQGDSNLYSWGLGTNHVILTGTEDERYQPHQVVKRILNNQKVIEITGGAQHTVYLTVGEGSKFPEQDSGKLKEKYVIQKGKLYGRVH